MSQTLSDEKPQINYHAARILILIAYAGKPVNSPKIKGRTLLAKYDFFLRYPVYLDKAMQKLMGKKLENLLEYEVSNVETRMIRYKYGPWDHIYYSVLTYLVAKDLISIRIKKNVEYFGLTNKGQEIVEELANIEVFQNLISRSQTLKILFPQWSGSKVKNFIYNSFPEVVALPIGEEI